MTQFTFSKTHQLDVSWFDMNGHLNVVGYLHYFVDTMSSYFRALGFDETTIEKHGGTMFALQQHLSYLAEIRGTETITCAPRLIACDRRRLHFMVLMHRENGSLAATMEQMAMYVDFQTRKPVEMPDQQYSKILNELDAHQAIELPATVGRAISMTPKAKK